jgi:adenosylhomocysteine nucleosidase
VDAHGLTFACALPAERRAAKRLGSTLLVGMACAHGVPDRDVISFGIAGSLRDDLPVGTVIDATRVVDESGAVLWEGAPIGVAPARNGTILGAARIVDDPAERARLHASTGADAVDMESATLARSGGLAGCIRAISDTPSRKLGGLAQAAKPTGEIDYGGLLLGFLRAPVETARAAAGARRALKALEAVA